jgi:hypothetical protein
VIAAPPPPCSALSIPGRAVEHRFALPGGRPAVLRDPHGGLIFRNRLFVSFSVRVGTPAQRKQLVDHVEWQLDADAAPLRSNRGGAYALLLKSTRIPAGEHKLTAHVVLRDGRTKDETIDLAATDCQPVSFFGDVAVNKGTRAEALLRVGSGGPALRQVSFTAGQALRATVPAARRGRAAGTLSFFDGRFPLRLSAPKALTLRFPARAAGPNVVLLRHGALTVTLHPGRRRMLDVRGLPAHTTGVSLRLLPGVIAPPHGCPVRSTIVATLVATGHGGTATASAGDRC